MTNICLFVTEVHYTLLKADELWRTTALIYVDNRQCYTVLWRTPDKEVVEYLILVFNCGQVLKFGAPLRYYKGTLTQKR